VNRAFEADGSDPIRSSMAVRMGDALVVAAAASTSIRFTELRRSGWDVLPICRYVFAKVKANVFQLAAG
jgi:hypothetical protein